MTTKVSLVNEGPYMANKRIRVSFQGQNNAGEWVTNRVEELGMKLSPQFVANAYLHDGLRLIVEEVKISEDENV
jgi:hypothetical protein